MTARERLAEIKARAEAATDGPWKWAPPSGSPWPSMDQNLWTDPDHEPVVTSWGYDADGISASDEDRAFIAHARTDIPQLVAALEAVLEFLPGPNDPCPLCTCIHVECEVLKAIDTALDGAS